MWCANYLAHLAKEKKLKAWGSMSVVNDIVSSQDRYRYDREETVQTGKTKVGFVRVSQRDC